MSILLRNPVYQHNGVTSSNLAWTRWYRNNRYVAIDKNGYIYAFVAKYFASGNEIYLFRSNNPYDYQNFTPFKLAGLGTAHFPEMKHGGYTPTLLIDKKNRLHITFTGDASGNTFPHPCYMVCTDLSYWNNSSYWLSGVIDTTYSSTMQSCLDKNSSNPIVYTLASRASDSRLYSYRQNSELGTTFSKSGSYIFQDRPGAFYPDCIYKNGEIHVLGTVDTGGYPLAYQKASISNFLNPPNWKNLYGIPGQSTLITGLPLASLASISSIDGIGYILCSPIAVGTKIAWIPTDEISSILYQSLTSPPPDLMLMQSFTIKIHPFNLFCFTGCKWTSPRQVYLFHTDTVTGTINRINWFTANYSEPTISVPVFILELFSGSQIPAVTATIDFAGSGMGSALIEYYLTMGPFEVEYTNPKDGDTDIPINTDITIRFNREVKKSSFKVTVYPSVKYLTNWIGDNEVKLVFTRTLSYDTEYTIIVDKNTEDIYGMRLSNDYIFNFKTVEVPIYKTGKPSFLIELFKRSPSLDIFTRVTNYSVLSCTLEERIDDSKYITLKLSPVRSRNEIVFPIDFRQGDDIFIRCKYSNTILFNARGIVINNIDSYRISRGEDNIELQLRGICSTLENSYSDIDTGKNKCLNALGKMLVGYTISDSDLHKYSLKLIASNGDKKRIRTQIEETVKGRILKYIEQSDEEIHFYERDAIIDETVNGLTVNSYLKIFKFGQDYIAYELNDSDIYACARKSQQPRYSGYLYKYGKRYVSGILDNYLQRIGRRDISEDEREVAKQKMIKEMMRDEEIEIVTNKPFNFRLGELIRFNLFELQFYRKGYLTSRVYNITGNSFECRMIFNSIPKPLKSELKLLLGLK